jgi:adenylate cyclase
LGSLGATESQIEAARREGTMSQLPTDLVLGRGVHLSAADLARSLGATPEAVVGLWRTLGVHVADQDVALFSDADADFTSLALGFAKAGPHTQELFRILGSSLARVAEAAVSLYVQTVEPKGNSSEGDLVAWASDLAETTTAALAMGNAAGAVFTHQLRDAIDRQRTAQAEVSERTLSRLAIGFVDLVGFTTLSQHAEPAALLELIGGFEARAYEVAAAHDGRIVKHIGDEVMFVALDPTAGCAIARELTAAVAEGVEPRGGLVFGDVITRHGDYYGPIVNLASRLADLAIPGEVLVDAATATAGRPAFAFRPAGHRLLKGFDVPIEVFSLESPGTD